MVEKDRGERIGEVRRIENDEKARITSAMMEELQHLLAGQEVALMLRNGTDLTADGDNVMLLLGGFTLVASTAVGYLYGTGYPVWKRVYP